jgi:hypothetical protein
MRREFNKIESVGDPNTLLLLHGDSFSDSSIFGASVTNVGGVEIVSGGKFDKAFFWATSGGGYRGWIDCDFGSNNRILNGVFTLDLWVKPTNIQKTYKVICDFCDHYTLYYDMSEPNKYTLVDFGNGSTSNWNNGVKDMWGIGGNLSACNFSVNVWTHVAIVGEGSTIKYYKNGIQQVCHTPSSGIVNYMMSMPNGKIRIGNIAYPGLYRNFRGFLSEIRFSNVARWTSNFVPPTTPY